LHFRATEQFVYNFYETCFVHMMMEGHSVFLGPEVPLN